MESSTKRIVSMYDSALDRDAMADHAWEYARYRDPETVKLIAGLEPTWFVVDNLTRAQKRWVEQAATIGERRERAFSVAVRSIENMPTNYPHQTLAQFLPSGTVGIPGAGQVRAFASTELERVPELFIEDIGEVIWYRSFFGHISAPRLPTDHLFLGGLVAAAYSRPAAAIAGSSST